MCPTSSFGFVLGNIAARSTVAESHSSTPSVDTGASLTNLDTFVSARYAALAHGSTLTNWIVSPVIAESLSKLKTATGSNQSLLQFVDDGIVVAGLPVLVSDQVDVDTLFWGVPKAHVMFVQRKGTTVERFPAVYNDGIDIRAVSRLGIAFLNEAGMVRGYNVA